MKSQYSAKTWAAGLAVFSMFFGSGNLVFPLLLGKEAGGETVYAILGLLLTAVLMPFLGVVSMLLLKGDYQRFFGSFGKAPYLFMCSVIIAIIGPFGVLPRCLTIAHAGMKMHFADLSLLPFSLIACAFIYFSSLKKGRLVDILGYVLTPALLFTLFVIVVKGLFMAPLQESTCTTIESPFLFGLKEGYNTMDLLAAFFFSRTLLRYFDDSESLNLGKAFKAGGIGISLLALTYLAFAFLGASFGNQLEQVAPEMLLMQVANEVLGGTGGVFASIAIALACLTTSMALADVSANFIQHDLLQGRISNNFVMLAVLLVSVFVSTYEFSGIAKFLSPILSVCYPICIAMTFFNLILSLSSRLRLIPSLKSLMRPSELR